MSASCEMTIKFHGSDEDFEKLLDKLYEIEGEKRKDYSGLFVPFSVVDRTITAHNGLCSNIWGYDYLCPEPDLYLDLAKTVPDAAFDIDSSRLYEGGGGGCETYVKVTYKDRKLTFELQSGVDTMSLLELVSCMESEIDCEDLNVVVTGRSKLFDTKDDFIRYIEDYGVTVEDIVTSETNYVICNNPNTNTIAIQKAKELGITVLSEAKFVRMFCDVYDLIDFDSLIDGAEEKILSDFTYEELCDNFEVDETITKEEFEKAIKHPENYDFVLWNDNHVSFEGPWEKREFITPIYK